MTNTKGIGEVIPIPDSFFNPELTRPGVYAITCKASGRTYIGSAVNVGKRWREHWHRLEAGAHHNHHMQNAWNKYGATAFTFSVLETLDEHSLLIAAEQRHIESQPKDRLYNLSPTAGSLLGFKQSPEAIEKMRRNFLGRHHTEETKRRLSERFRGQTRRKPGWRMTEEQKEKLRLCRTGKPLTPEHRAKATATLMRSNKARVGIPWTEEHRRNLANARRALSNEQVLASREAYRKGKSLDVIANDLGTNRKSVERAVRGIGTYGSIGTPMLEKVKRPAYNKGKPGRAWTPEQKAKASATHKRIGLTEAQRKKLAEAQRRPEMRELKRRQMLGNQYTKGRPLTEEHKAVLSAVLKGRVRSPETRERMRLAAQKRWSAATQK